MRGMTPERDRGAIAVTVALTMTLLLGVGALVVDVGAVFAERRMLQNAADAAAFAIAKDCSDDVCGSTAPAAALHWAELNSQGHDIEVSLCGGGISHPDVPACTVPPPPESQQGSGWVRVSVTSVVNFALMPGSKTVTADAVVAWGGTGTAVVGPLMISECAFQDAGGNLDTGTVPSAETTTFDSYADPLLTGLTDCRVATMKRLKQVPRDFGWLTIAYKASTSKCSRSITVGNYYRGDKGGNVIRDDMKRQTIKGTYDCTQGFMKDQTVIVPIFDEATYIEHEPRTAGGRCTPKQDGNIGYDDKCWIYHVVGFAAFHVTGYDLNRDKQDPLMHDGKPNLNYAKYPDGFACRVTGAKDSDMCVVGYFERIVSGDNFGAGYDYGIRIIKMVG